LYKETFLFLFSFEYLKIPSPGQPDEFTVKTMGDSFWISEYPLQQSSFLFDMLQGKKKFDDETNKYFDYTLFNYSTVRLFYDILHGVPQFGVHVRDAIDLGILVGFDGQLKQKSEKEKSIFEALIRQLFDKALDGKEKALVWLYVKTWNAYGAHIIEYEQFVSEWVIDTDDDGVKVDLWTFHKKDVDAALVAMLYPVTEDTNSLQIIELKEMILERFDNDLDKYFEWSLKMRDEMRIKDQKKKTVYCEECRQIHEDNSQW